jgi:hypothetical protein
MKTDFKIRIALLTFLMTMFSSFAIFGQENDSTRLKFGLGASLLNLTEYAYENQSPSSIYLTIDIGSKLRLEPSIGFALSDGFSNYCIGIGVFRKKMISKFNLLYGARLGFGSSEILFIAPSIGGEYYFIKNFSLGSEVQLRGSIDSGDWVVLTNASVLIRFYF